MDFNLDQQDLFWDNDPLREPSYVIDTHTEPRHDTEQNPYDTDEYPLPPEPDAEQTADHERVSTATTVVEVFAGLHGRLPEKVGEFADTIRNSDQLKQAVDEDVWNTIDGFSQLVERTAAHTTESSFDMTFLPSKKAFSDRVHAMHSAVCDRIGSANDPHLVWAALCDELLVREAERAAGRLLRSLTTRDNPDKMLAAFDRVVETRPVRTAASSREKRNYRATAVYEEWQAAQNGTSGMRLSCGLASIDVALTPKGSPVGLIAPGEQVLMAGDTGTGKTSMCYAMGSALTNDVIAWGLPDGLVVLAHTEEEEKDKIEGMRMAPGQRFASLGNNMVVKNVGTSRRSVVELFYDLVMDAHENSQSTGRPITEFLPYVFILDYIQALSESGESESESTRITAEFVMRGIQRWNPYEMAKHGGISFEEYAGYAWPAGMERHRVAVVAFAQLIKIDAGSNFYDPNSKQPLTDFTLEYQDGDPVTTPWVGPDGRQYCWEVRPGDARLLGRNEVRGHGQVLQNATALLFLHRSRPTNNPAIGNHLQDRRARIQLGKTRNGSAQKFIPLEFDLQPDGPKAQYFDPTAFAAVQRGILHPHGVFTQYGDPICPQRGEKDPFMDVNYQTLLTP